MYFPSLLYGPAPCPGLEEVNTEIRRLMEEPVGVRRTEEYIRLLSLWTEAHVIPLVSIATHHPSLSRPVSDTGLGVVPKYLDRMRDLFAGVSLTG